MMDKNILLSIIIPVYNVEKYIGKCLDSIVSSNNDIEVIVIDDGSADESGRIADIYASKYSFIKVVHNANSGVAASRNVGMEIAHGDWFYFVDSDDWLAEGAVDMICRRAVANSDSDIIMFDAYKNTMDSETGWEHFGNDMVFDTPEGLKSIQRGVLYFPACDEVTGIPLAAPWDKVYKRRFILDNHLRFQEGLRVLDDMVFNMEAFGKAKRVVYYKDKIYHYRFVEASITNSYSPNRVMRDIEVWDYIGAYMADNSLSDDEGFKQAYYCRIVKSFSICCRLNFFNSQNEKSLPDKLRAVRKVMETEPYRTAFKNVNLANAEWRLKIMVMVCRAKSSLCVWLLHIAQNGL
jgi:glycosyltransferase involved in cell wall biosynthesis